MKGILISYPISGLLAGLYEFPSFTLPITTTPSGPLPLPKLLTHLRTLLPRRLLKDPTHKPLESTFHQYSHISMTYHVSHLVISPPDAEEGEEEQEPPEVERGTWVVGKAGVEGLSMGTGGKKCWQLLVGTGKGKAAPKRRAKKAVVAGADDAEEVQDEKGKAKGKGREKKKAKKDEDDPGQTTLSTFFTKPVASSSARSIPASITPSTIDAISSSSTSTTLSQPLPPPQKPKKKPKKRKYAAVSESESSDDDIQIVGDPAPAPATEGV